VAILWFLHFIPKFHEFAPVLPKGLDTIVPPYLVRILKWLTVLFVLKER